VVLYVLLTGKYPFVEPDMMKKIEHCEMDYPADIPEGARGTFIQDFPFHLVNRN
jgi:hypothetical protein